MRADFLQCSQLQIHGAPGSYILTQNAAIAAGTVSGSHINLKVLGVGDGLTVRYTQNVMSVGRINAHHTP